VTSFQNFSKLSANILLITHFLTTSLTKGKPCGIISLNKTLQQVVSIIFQSILTLTKALRSIALASYARSKSILEAKT